VRRRFQKRIHIPLPDGPARRQLFRIHGGEDFAEFSEENFEVMAGFTNGFSGSDVANVVQEALSLPLKTVRRATHFKKVGWHGSVAESVSGLMNWVCVCRSRRATLSG
jgi:vacuolar protein-sorting-associated protein 4